MTGTLVTRLRLLLSRVRRIDRGHYLRRCECENSKLDTTDSEVTTANLPWVRRVVAEPSVGVAFTFSNQCCFYEYSIGVHDKLLRQ